MDPEDRFFLNRATSVPFYVWKSFSLFQIRLVNMSQWNLKLVIAVSLSTMEIYEITRLKIRFSGTDTLNVALGSDTLNVALRLLSVTH